MMIVIAGGTGFLGKCLSDYYTSLGHHIIILSRKHQIDTDTISYFKWDGKTVGAWTQALEGSDVLINLTGKSVDCRYNERNKQDIYDSRIDAAVVLSKALRLAENPPKVWLNAASATIYRHAEDREMDEDTGELGDGFSVDVCKKWESAFLGSDNKGIRRVAMRIAIVLGDDGGALVPLLRLVKLGLGGSHGSGSQYFSWVDKQDFCRAVDFIITHDDMAGCINIAAPCPETNRQAMKLLRNRVNIPFGLPQPKWLLELGAWLIGTETELLLKSRRVVPKALLDKGFLFSYPSLEKALSNH